MTDISFLVLCADILERGIPLLDKVRNTQVGFNTEAGFSSWPWGRSWRLDGSTLVARYAPKLYQSIGKSVFEGIAFGLARVEGTFLLSYEKPCALVALCDQSAEGHEGEFSTGSRAFWHPLSAGQVVLPPAHGRKGGFRVNRERGDSFFLLFLSA